MYSERTRLMEASQEIGTTLITRNRGVWEKVRWDRWRIRGDISVSPRTEITSDIIVSYCANNDMWVMM